MPQLPIGVNEARHHRLNFILAAFRLPLRLLLDDVLNSVRKSLRINDRRLFDLPLAMNERDLLPKRVQLLVQHRLQLLVLGEKVLPQLDPEALRGEAGMLLGEDALAAAQPV